jgi:Uma2 family endonuclease
MIATLRPQTYDDLREMPDDRQRYEIINGELIVAPAPTSGHQRVLAQLYRQLDDHVHETGEGEVFFAPFDVKLGRFDIAEPDIVFLAASRPRVPDSDNAIGYPPDLVVEVLSPSSRSTDRVKKMALYARSGVREYWIVDPERRTLVVNALDGEDYRAVESNAQGWVASRVFPGRLVDPAEVFAGLD